MVLKGRVVSDALPCSRFVDVEVSDYRVRLFFKGKIPKISYGDIVRVSGVAFVPYHYKNPGSFDVVRYMNSKNIAFFLKVRRWRVLERGEGLRVWLHYLRVRLYAFSQTFKEPLRSFIPAIILGIKEPMAEYSPAFYRLGLGHILAISGLHLGIFIAVFYRIFLWILRGLNLVVQFPFLLLPRRMAYLIVLLLMPMVLVITGNQISVQRAAFMYLIYVIVAVFLERSAYLLNVLLVALSFFALIRPEEITSAGFQYTFLAVLVLGILEKRFPDMSGFKKATVASLVLPLALFPVGAYHFHCLYPLGSLFNALLLPVFSAVIACIILLFPLAFLLKGPFVGLLHLLNAVVAPLFKMVLLFSELPKATIPATRFCFWMTACFSVLLIYLLVRKRVLLVLTMALFLISLWVFWQTERNRVVFFDMGKAGEATLVVKDGKAFLVNAGGRGREAGKALYDALLWEGVTHLDKVICTTKRKASISLVRFISRKMNALELDGCDTLWEGNCRKVLVAGVSFVCFKSQCDGGICKVAGGPVFVGKRELYPYRTGALKFYLED